MAHGVGACTNKQNWGAMLLLLPNACVQREERSQQLHSPHHIFLLGLVSLRVL